MHQNFGVGKKSEKKFNRDIQLGQKSSKSGIPTLKFNFKKFLPLFSTQKIHRKFQVGRKSSEKYFDFAYPNL